MDEEIFQLIDDCANETAESLHLAVSALEGAYSRNYRLMPNNLGLQRFLAETAKYPSLGADLVSARLSRFASDANVTSDQTIVSLAMEQAAGLVNQIRLSEARRFRSSVTARTSIAPAFSSLRILNRAGQQRSASEMFYVHSRKAALDLFNEAQVSELIADGQLMAKVVHRDPTHKVHGKTFELADYLSVSSTVFHPRANAIVGRI